MASYTLKTPPTFPDGTTVGAYLARGQTSATAGPLGSPVNEQVASSGQAAFTGLTYGEAYVAFGFVGGQWKRYGFSVDPPNADLLPYYSTAGSELAPLTAFGRSMLDDEDATAALSTLGVLDLIPTEAEGGWGSDGQFFKKSGVEIGNSNVPAYKIPLGAKVFRVDQDGRVHMGENRLLKDAIETNMHNSVIDAMYDSSTMRFYSRSFIATEVGDSPEFQFRRAGPDNNYPYPSGGGLAGVLSATTLGQITWYPFCTPDGGTPGVTTGAGINNPAGAIYMHAAQAPFSGKTGGEMYFSTTPIDAGNYIAALAIMSNQHIFNGAAGADLGRFSITNPAGDEASKVAVFRGADSQSANTLEVQTGSSHTASFAVTGSGDTSHANGKNIILGTSTGTKIGTAANQKLGFWDATPVVQQVLATGAAHTVDDVITFLQTVGLAKQS